MNMTFAQLVQYGRDNGANIVNGMPWSFTYRGYAVTHENDQCYLIGAVAVRMTPADLLVMENGFVFTRPLSEIAKIAHNVNRAYCQAIGDYSQPAWDEAPDWQKESAVKGVEVHLASDLSPAQSHESWLAEKYANGWKYGPIKDADKKTHPCCVPYLQLPQEQRIKDYLFKSVVESFK